MGGCYGPGTGFPIYPGFAICQSGCFKKLVDSEDLWEVRIQFGNDIFRLLGFFDGGTLLILTNGFAKKTQKTPAQEIALAIRCKEEYLARRKK